MISKTLKIGGIAFFSLLLLGMAGLGAAFGFMQIDKPSHVEKAQTLARSLAQTWSYDAIREEFLPQVAANVDEAAAKQAFDSLRVLGPMVEADAVSLDDYNVSYTINLGLVRQSTISFTGRYAHGAADITVVLVTANGVTRVQHLNVKPHALPRPPQRRSYA